MARAGGGHALSKIALRRLLTELESLAKDPPPGISACPAGEDRWHEWDCVIIGPEDTLYDGGAFRARLVFPPQYPMQPPKMFFTTAMWHPNIYKGGDVSQPTCALFAQDNDRLVATLLSVTCLRPRSPLRLDRSAYSSVAYRSEMERFAFPLFTLPLATQ